MSREEILEVAAQLCHLLKYDFLFIPVSMRWMTCNFMSLLTVFQSYQDDGWGIMKGFM